MHCQHHLVTLTDAEHLLSNDTARNRLAHVLNDLTTVDAGASFAGLVVELDALLGLGETQVVVAEQQPTR